MKYKQQVSNRNCQERDTFVLIVEVRRNGSFQQTDVSEWRLDVNLRNDHLMDL